MYAPEGCASGCCIAKGVPALVELTPAVRPARTPGSPSASLPALPGLPKCSALCAGADAAALPPRLARALRQHRQMITSARRDVQTSAVPCQLRPYSARCCS